MKLHKAMKQMKMSKKLQDKKGRNNLTRNKQFWQLLTQNLSANISFCEVGSLK